MATKAKRKGDFPPDQAIVQCEKCKVIKMRSFYKGKDYFKQSIVTMPKVKQSLCYGCKKGS